MYQTIPKCRSRFRGSFSYVNSFQVNNILTYTQISNTLFVKEQAIANMTCSFRRNIRLYWGAFRIMSTNIIKTGTPRNKSIKVICSAATVILNLKPFKFTNVQKLQDPYGVARVQLCDWSCDADSRGEVDHCQRILQLILLKPRVNKPGTPGRSRNYVLYGGA